MNIEFKKFTGETSLMALQLPVLRQRYDLTQKEVSAAARIHEGELGKIEKGVIPTTDEYATWLISIIERLHEAKESRRGEVSAI